MSRVTDVRYVRYAVPHHRIAFLPDPACLNHVAYYVTPAGSAVEYTSELEEIDEDGWEPRTFAPAPDIMDQWGIGSGGPQSMPRPAPDAGLSTPSGV